MTAQHARALAKIFNVSTERKDKLFFGPAEIMLMGEHAFKGPHASPDNVSDSPLISRLNLHSSRYSGTSALRFVDNHVVHGSPARLNYLHSLLFRLVFALRGIMSFSPNLGRRDSHVLSAPERQDSAHTSPDAIQCAAYDHFLEGRS